MEKAVDTPRKLYCKRNICLLCGFSFVQIETAASGELIEKKLFKQKLRLTDDRLQKIRQVIDFDTSDDDNNGVCIRCFRRVEGVLKMQGDIAAQKTELMASRAKVLQQILSLPSPRRVNFQKRMLRSPTVVQPVKQYRFPTEVVVKSPVKLLSLPAIQMKINSPRQQINIPQVPHAQAESSVVTKSAKRSLGFTSGKENEPFNMTPLDGSVEINIYYASGKKTMLVRPELHKSICKAIVRDVNVERVIVGKLVESCPQQLLSGSTQIIKEECKKICKKGFRTILQSKTYADFFDFSWEKMHTELIKLCPGLISIVSAIVSDTPLYPSIQHKPFHHVMLTVAVGLHGRSQEMSVIQYIIGFILTHGGCTQSNIRRLSQIGLSVDPQTITRKMSQWQDMLDSEIIFLRDSWSNGSNKKYQLVGDNWDKNILPSYRTSDRKTISLHLFNIYAIVDRVIPRPLPSYTSLVDVSELKVKSFIPSEQEQELLMKEFTFIFASAVISDIEQMNDIFKDIYPKHLSHTNSYTAGAKTVQYSLGLFDCNENKTKEMIKLLKDLSATYVPCMDGEMVESVFLGGDRLTDERVQGAQKAMLNGATPIQRLEGFISKIEDFHRLMNFLEAIHKMTYNTQSGPDKCTAYYYRNLLNMRNVKGKVKNAYRAHKMLYYIILDAICVMLFLHHFNISNMETDIPLPDGFEQRSKNEKIEWLNSICEEVLREWFFDGSTDIFGLLRDILTNPDHPENYWVAHLEEGRVKCHFCDKTYAYVGSLKSHEMKKHKVNVEKKKKKSKDIDTDELKNYILMLFKLLMLHKNLDTAVDMGDGERSVRSAKYELPIYNRTNKTKYLIGSVHLTSLTSGVLPREQTERLIANRFVNVQGGRNNNIALDEYLEMLNRDSKVACSGYKTKESIIRHSKEYPHLSKAVRHFDVICNRRKRKGFHHLPSYQSDVLKVTKDLLEQDVLTSTPGRKFHCRGLETERNPFATSFVGLSTMIHRHKPSLPFRRLRDPHI